MEKSNNLLQEMRGDYAANEMKQSYEYKDTCTVTNKRDATTDDSPPISEDLRTTMKNKL